MNTYKNKYTEELQRLKSWDEVQFMTTDREYNFIKKVEKMFISY